MPEEGVDEERMPARFLDEVVDVDRRCGVAGARAAEEGVDEIATVVGAEPVDRHAHQRLCGEHCAEALGR